MKNRPRLRRKPSRTNSSLKEAAVALGYVSAEDYDKWVNPREMTNVDR
jgi:fumarate hydratase class II